MTALALAPAPLPDAGSAARLEALLDEGFLASAGWDAQAMLLSPPASHPGLGWPECQVPGCHGIAESRRGTAHVCGACVRYMDSAGTTEVPAECPKSFTTGVGRCAAGCPRPWESSRRPLCAAHDHQQRAVLRVTVEEFLAWPGVVPLPGFGQCQALACTRLRYSGTSPFCKAHQTRWQQAARSDPSLEGRQWCRTESAVAEGGRDQPPGPPPADGRGDPLRPAAAL